MDANTKEQLQTLLGQESLLFLLGLFALIFKTTIEKFAAAIFVFFGNDYKEDDIITLNGRPGRIIRIGLTKTTFFLYEIRNGLITGGSKLVIQNEKLAEMHIEKPLQKIDIDHLIDTIKQDMPTKK